MPIILRLGKMVHSTRGRVLFATISARLCPGTEGPVLRSQDPDRQERSEHEEHPSSSNNRYPAGFGERLSGGRVIHHVGRIVHGTVLGLGRSAFAGIVLEGLARLSVAVRVQPVWVAGVAVVFFLGRLRGGEVFAIEILARIAVTAPGLRA